MTERALATAVDVAVALLCVSAAVVLLSTVPTPEPAPRASPGATLDIVGAAPVSAAHTAVNGTLLDILAAGAIADARGDTGLLNRYRSRAAKLLNRTTGHRQVRVTWSPVPQAGIAGRVIVGPQPPDGAEVDAVRTVVPIPVRASSDSLSQAATTSFDALAKAVAERLVSRLYHPCDRAGAIRERRCNGSLSGPRVRTLASRLRRHFARSYATPAGARADLSLATITVTVRTWHL